MRITDLAETLVRLSGKSRQEFKFIGLRPGEKLFEELFYSDERVFPSACEKIACTEGVKLAWPALKRSLDELYVAMSLGQREPILTQLKRIVPQFTYAGCDQAGSAENISSSPSVSDLQPDVQPEAPVLVDMPAAPYLPWPANPQATPPLKLKLELGSAGSGPGD